VKRLLANATIDEFVAFEGRFESVKTFYAGNVSPGYFTNQQGEYANVFEIPLPPYIDSVVLRSLDWTSYYPTTYTDHLSTTTQRVRVEPMTCEVNFRVAGGGSLPGPFREPWRLTTDPINRVAGRRIARKTGGIMGNNAELVYKFRMPGARAQRGGVVGSPVIDDVTLTYFLPNPKILLQEDVE
jgi:hypothetical protein